MTTYEEFFEWCARVGLGSDREIAAALGRTPQTVSNWRRGRPRSREGKPPAHLALACRGYEVSLRSKGRLPAVMTAGWFDVWRETHGLATFDQTGKVFGLTRQAIHAWEARDRLPKWLPLACLGHDHAVQNRTANKET